MSLGAALQELRAEGAKRASVLALAARARVRRTVAQAWMRFFRGRQWVASFLVRRTGPAVGVLATGLLGASLLYLPQLQTGLSGYVDSTDAVHGLKDVLVNVGGAMIGAAAFAFTLIMFAMQVNVERMPHGLFRKFSSDPGLLATFSASVVCALWIAVSPAFLNAETLAPVLLSAGWATLIVFALFLVAYRRALRLISPTEQLQIVVRTAQQDMKRWSRIAERTRALFEGEEPPRDERLGPGADLALTAFFRLHGHWTIQAEQSLMHAIAFSRRFAERGDHEVADVALNAILAINATYVRVKARTFFAQHPMIDNPLVTDSFINTTLEHLRQNVQIAIGRRDERAISQNVRALAGLTQLYLTIDYGGVHHAKTHSLLAAGYLSDAIQGIAPHNFPDRLMEGVRLLGTAANAFIATRQFTDVASFGGYIATIGAVGVARTDHKPVLSTAVDELAKITFNLVRVKEGEVRFALSEIKKNLSLLALMCLATPDGQFGTGHSFYLASYYSGTTHQGLLSWLHDLVNALIEAKEDDAAVSSVLDNLALFSEDLYRTEKEIMLASIKAKSSFTLDIIHWISSVSILLWAAAGAETCDDDTKEELQKHGLWLASVLSWIPHEPDAVEVIERYRLADTLFNLAFEAYRRVGPGPVADRVNKLQLSWAIGAAAHGAHWGSLDQSLCGIAVMALWRGDSEAMLAALTKAITEAKKQPEQELLDRAARELRRRSERLWEERHTLSHIGSAMAAADHGKLEPLLKSIADVISPGTAEEGIDRHLF